MKDEILKQIQTLFSNTSQEAIETLEQLEEIRSEIDILIEALEADGVG